MAETVTINGREFRVVGSTPAQPTPPARRKAHRTIPKPLDGKALAIGWLKLSVPPPSVNSLFHNRAKGRGKTLVYKNWCALADQEIRAQPSWHVPGKVEVRLLLADGTRGDADNRIKAALDSLVNAGRIEDDSNVVKVSAEYAALEAGVAAVILIERRP